MIYRIHGCRLPALLLAASALLTCNADRWAHAEEIARAEEPTQAKTESQANGVGAGKAVTAADPKQGLRLSETALKSLEIRMVPTSGGLLHSLPLDALIVSQAESAIYRQRANWFKRVEVEVVRRGTASIVVKTAELQAGDQVVVHGGPLLRITELNVWAGEEAGH